MPKRETIESRIINYFRDEEMSKATLVYGLVRGEMAKRQPKKRKSKLKPEVDKDLSSSKHPTVGGSYGDQ